MNIPNCIETPKRVGRCQAKLSESKPAQPSPSRRMEQKDQTAEVPALADLPKYAFSRLVNPPFPNHQTTTLAPDHRHPRRPRRVHYRPGNLRIAQLLDDSLRRGFGGRTCKECGEPFCNLYQAIFLPHHIKTVHHLFGRRPGYAVRVEPMNTATAEPPERNQNNTSKDKGVWNNQCDCFGNSR